MRGKRTSDAERTLFCAACGKDKVYAYAKEKGKRKTCSRECAARRRRGIPLVEEPRDKFLHVRVTLDEYLEITRAANRINKGEGTRSDWIVSVLLDAAKEKR